MARPPAPARRRRWMVVLKLALFAIVAYYVVRQGWGMWDDVREQQFTLSWGWLMAAVPVSLLGWLPAARVFQQMLESLGPPLRFRDAARSYYAGHVAKYVPGKAVVVLVRTALLERCGYSVLPVAIAVTYETLLTMAAGTCLGLWLLPWVTDLGQLSPGWSHLLSTWSERLLWGGLVFAGCVISLHVLTNRLLAFLARRKSRDLLPPPPSSQAEGAARDATAISESPEISGELPETAADAAAATTLPAAVLRRVALRSTVFRLLILMGGWWMHGLSLGLTLRALNEDVSFSAAHWPLWTAAVTAGIVLGFLAVFAPGGAVVREAAVYHVLRSQLPPATALLVAVLWRAVGLTGELLGSALLYYTISPQPVAAEHGPSHQQSESRRSDAE